MRNPNPSPRITVVHRVLHRVLHRARHRVRVRVRVHRVDRVRSSFPFRPSSTVVVVVVESGSTQLCPFGTHRRSRSTLRETLALSETTIHYLRKHREGAAARRGFSCGGPRHSRALRARLVRSETRREETKAKKRGSVTVARSFEDDRITKPAWTDAVDSTLVISQDKVIIIQTQS